LTVPPTCSQLRLAPPPRCAQRRCFFHEQWKHGAKQFDDISRNDECNACLFDPKARGPPRPPIRSGTSWSTQTYVQPTTSLSPPSYAAYTHSQRWSPRPGIHLLYIPYLEELRTSTTIPLSSPLLSFLASHIWLPPFSFVNKSFDFLLGNISLPFIVLFIAPSLYVFAPPHTKGRRLPPTRRRWTLSSPGVVVSRPNVGADRTVPFLAQAPQMSKHRGGCLGLSHVTFCPFPFHFPGCASTGGGA